MKKYEILEKTIKKFVLGDFKKYDLPENFLDVAIDIFPYGNYGNIAKITVVMKNPFTMEESDLFDRPLYNIKNHISVIFSDYLKAGVSSSISTKENYDKTSRLDYEERKKLLESKNKNVIITQKQFNLIVNEGRNNI